MPQFVINNRPGLTDMLEQKGITFLTVGLKVMIKGITADEFFQLGGLHAYITLKKDEREQEKSMTDVYQISQ